MNTNNQINSAVLFEVHINKDKSYYIHQVNNVDEINSVTTLKNIERIVTENLTYSPDIIDNYSKLKESDRLELLNTTSHLIDQKYQESVKNSSWLYKTLVSQENYVHSMSEKIDAAVTEKTQIPENALKELPLNDDIINQLSGYLNVADVANLKQAGSSIKNQADLMEVKLAKEFGFVGADTDNVEAKKYLEEFFSEIREMCQSKIIPEEHIAYKNDKKIVDLERTATNLQNLTPDEIISVLLFKKQGAISSRVKQYIGSECYEMNKKLVQPVQAAKTYKVMNNAIRFGQMGLVKFLLKNAFSNFSAEEQNDLVILAVNAKNADCLKLLLKYGFKISVLDPLTDYSPLCMACNPPNLWGTKVDPRIIEILLDNGADPNSADSEGNTPLGLIIDSGSLESIKLLLAHGAEIEGKTGNQLRTPLQIACLKWKQPNREVIECLLKNGANPNTPLNEEGQTILDKISKKKKITRQLLESYGAKQGVKDS